MTPHVSHHPPANAGRTDPITRTLKAGQVFHEAGCFAADVWQVEQGALRLDLVNAEGERLVQLVLAGDHLGLESLCGLPTLYRTTALTPCVLRRLDLGYEQQRRDVMRVALVQQWCRAADQTALRTGTAGERVRQLLLLLAAGGQARIDGLTAVTLPRLRDMAAIVNTALATVSRILSRWRRQGVLQGAGAAAVQVDTRCLAACEIPRDITRSSRRARTAPQRGVDA